MYQIPPPVYTLSFTIQEYFNILKDKDASSDLKIVIAQNLNNLINNKFEDIQAELNHSVYDNYITGEIESLEYRKRQLRKDIEDIQNKEILVLDGNGKHDNSFKLLEDKESEYNELEDNIRIIKSKYENGIINRIYGDYYTDELKRLSDENIDLYNKIFEFRNTLREEQSRLSSDVDVSIKLNEESLEDIKNRLDNELQSHIFYVETKIPDIENQLEDHKKCLDRIPDIENQLKNLNTVDKYTPATSSVQTNTYDIWNNYVLPKE